jgi:hypothetical protein
LILKQYAFTTKAWTAPDGTWGLIPKDKGAGVIISAFVSREYGFGMDIRPDDLARVNERRNRKKYLDEMVANSSQWQSKQTATYKKSLCD